MTRADIVKLGLAAEGALAERDRRRPTETGYPEPTFSVSAVDLAELTRLALQGAKP